jgi:uncharacterized membrane protein
MGFPFWQVYLVCVLGNLLPVPFLLLFGRRLLVWLADWPYVGNFFRRVIDKADKAARGFGRYEFFGLWAFVAIPFPGTGAWTGSVAATFLRMPLPRAMLAISLGVLTAGIVMGVASYGLLEAIGILL